MEKRNKVISPIVGDVVYRLFCKHWGTWQSDTIDDDYFRIVDLASWLLSFCKENRNCVAEFEGIRIDAVRWDGTVWQKEGVIYERVREK